MKSKTYEEFVEKFKPKKTTDDCITPPLIYEAVKTWACNEYGIDPECIVRPFWPGGDYERFDYPDGCVVLDNPPFSLSSKIYRFYLERDIPFFLFAPALTCLNAVLYDRVNHIFSNSEIEYENGAIVRTAFVTTYGGDVVAQTAPSLGRAIEQAKKELHAEKPSLPKYDYPDHIVTGAMLNQYAKYGIDFKLRRGECVHISAMDDQREKKKSIFGGGLLVSDRKAAEKAAAEKAAATQWRLSEKEKELVAGLK